MSTADVIAHRLAVKKYQKWHYRAGLCRDCRRGKDYAFLCAKHRRLATERNKRYQ